jgi:hypothetical protein
VLAFLLVLMQVPRCPSALLGVLVAVFIGYVAGMVMMPSDVASIGNGRPWRRFPQGKKYGEP